MSLPCFQDAEHCSWLVASLWAAVKACWVSPRLPPAQGGTGALSREDLLTNHPWVPSILTLPREY